jgi:hypothetical protein
VPCVFHANVALVAREILFGAVPILTLTAVAASAGCANAIAAKSSSGTSRKRGREAALTGRSEHLARRALNNCLLGGKDDFPDIGRYRTTL